MKTGIRGNMKGIQYHLTCDNCEHTFWSKEAFPIPQLCGKCKKLKISK